MISSRFDLASIIVQNYLPVRLWSVTLINLIECFLEENKHPKPSPNLQDRTPKKSAENSVELMNVVQISLKELNKHVSFSFPMRCDSDSCSQMWVLVIYEIFWKFICHYFSQLLLLLLLFYVNSLVIEVWDVIIIKTHMLIRVEVTYNRWLIS